MLDLDCSPFGYYVAPDGTVHPMLEFQGHDSWINARHGEEWKLDHIVGAQGEALGRGWATVTFAMARTGFSIRLDEERVTRLAVRALQLLLRTHQPEPGDGIHVNDALAVDGGYATWRAASAALAKFPVRATSEPR